MSDVRNPLTAVKVGIAILAAVMQVRILCAAMSAQSDEVVIVVSMAHAGMSAASDVEARFRSIMSSPGTNLNGRDPCGLYLLVR